MEHHQLDIERDTGIADFPLAIQYTTFYSTIALTCSELEAMRVALLENPPPVSVVPPPSHPLQEEDQLNLVVRSLKHPTLPPQTKLTSDNFEQHISNFIKTAVVFCVKCK